MLTSAFEVWQRYTRNGSQGVENTSHGGRVLISGCRAQIQDILHLPKRVMYEFQLGKLHHVPQGTYILARVKSSLQTKRLHPYWLRPRLSGIARSLGAVYAVMRMRSGKMCPHKSRDQNNTRVVRSLWCERWLYFEFSCF